MSVPPLYYTLPSGSMTERHTNGGSVGSARRVLSCRILFYDTPTNPGDWWAEQGHLSGVDGGGTIPNYRIWNDTGVDLYFDNPEGLDIGTDL